MKTFYRLAMFYAVLGIVGGVFYREFTKFNAFLGTTTLGFVHAHALVLGMLFFLVLILMEKQFQFSESKHFRKFLGFYNTGLLCTITMLIVRGITQVWKTDLRTGTTATISGLAGISHILLGMGLIYFFLILKERISHTL